MDMPMSTQRGGEGGFRAQVHSERGLTGDQKCTCFKCQARGMLFVFACFMPHAICHAHAPTLHWQCALSLSPRCAKRQSQARPRTSPKPALAD